MDNWDKIEFLFIYRLKVSKQQLRELEFWDVEKTLDLWKEQINKEKEESDKQQKDMEKQQKAQQMSQPKIPKMTPSTNYGGYKVPRH